MFVNLFKKDCGGYSRYWASVSTEIYDAKKGKGTGDYVRANISVRLSKDANEVFEEIAEKTANKKITMGRFEVVKSLFEAVQPKDDEEFPYVRFVIIDMKEAESDKPESKGKGKH